MLVRVGALALFFAVAVDALRVPVAAFLRRRSRSGSRSRNTRRRVGIISAADAGAVPDRPRYWYEEPAETRRVSAPFGRAEKGVEERLGSLNWRKLRRRERHEQQPVPSFTFRYPGAPTFCAYRPGVFGPIRQIPREWDDHVDDKLRLHLLLSTNSSATRHIMPPTFEVNHAFLASLEARQDGETNEGHWFLKHRLDSKRPRVHPYAGDAELRDRLRGTKESSWKYFVAQKEIRPAMLLRGRKFVLRAHALAIVRGDASRLFLHDNPLVCENEAPFEVGRAWASHPASALVSQSGTRSPAYLLTESEELSFWRASILEQTSGTASTVFRELRAHHPFPFPSDTRKGAMYQIYGLDFMLDSSGKVFLLEVNRSPRIATGAMGDVHGCYTELLMQAMKILGVIETTGSEEPSGPGKFGAWLDIYRAAL